MKKVSINDFYYILCVVENTDKANPDTEEFRRIIPQIHLVKKALEIVAYYGKMSKLYCQTLVEKYESVFSPEVEDCFPYEIERAIIRLKNINLIYDLTNAGHTWSKRAQKLMKWLRPLQYEHNINNQLPPREALIYLTVQELADHSEAEKKIPLRLLINFCDRGYICHAGANWQITDLGCRQAKLYFDRQFARLCCAKLA